MMTVGLLFLTTASVLATSSTAQTPPAEAPAPIPFTAGKWEAASGRTATLRYLAPVFPNLSLDSLVVECAFQGMWVEATGMVPLQRFPQPELRVSTGDGSWANFANASYSPRSEPEAWSPPADLPLEDNLKKGLKNGKFHWAGHPPYARLKAYIRYDLALVEALSRGKPIRVQFADQAREFPAVPSDVARAFTDGCAKAQKHFPFATPRPQTTRPDLAPPGNAR